MLFSLFFILASNIDQLALTCGSTPYTLSQVTYLKGKLATFAKFAPQLFGEIKSNKDIVNFLMRNYLIEEELKSQSINITEDMIKDSIEGNRAKGKLTMDQFLNQLAMEGLNYNDYFFLMKSNMLYSSLLERILLPQINISAQEITDYYTKHLAKKESLVYELVNFSIGAQELSPAQLQRLVTDLQQFKKSGSLPTHLRQIESNSIGKIKESDLSQEVLAVVKKGKLHQFTSPLLLNNRYHSFYIAAIEEKDREENLKNNRDKIENILYQEKINVLIKNWPEEVKSKYYIRTFL